MSSTHVMNWRNRIKCKLIAYKGGRCQRCGYNKNCPAVYVFHHRDPVKKSFGLGGKTLSFERLKCEADKCDLLCHNCHNELHWELQEVDRLKRIDEVRQVVPLENIQCGYCKKRFKQTARGQYYCSPICYNTGRRKVKRPTRQQLIKLLAKTSWTAIGRTYGVSDNAVRKWAKSYGLLAR